MTNQEQAWVIRAGGENVLATEIEAKWAMAIGWYELGDACNLKTREQFKAHFRQIFPEYSKPRIAVNAGQVYRFIREINLEDVVMTYIKSSREVLIGLVKSPCRYDPELFAKEFPFVRKVDWLRTVSRDDFSAAAKNSLGSSLTVFSMSDHLQEIQELITGTKPVVEADEESEETPPFYEEVKSQSEELISDMITHLDAYEFQNLVAGLLEAMGYRAVSSPPGRDRGVDVVAYPDALGFKRPRIKAQVKHRKDKATGPEMRELSGLLRNDDNGLFISSGGFTDEAKVEADHSHRRITFLDREAFIRLLLEYYEQLDHEFQTLVPLKSIWVPIK